MFCLASLSILFKFSIDIFWSKTLKDHSFLRPQIIFCGPNYTFLHTNNTKIFQKFCLTSLSILFKFSIDIFLSKTLKRSFIFEAPDYILRPQIIFWGPNYTFLHSNKTKISKIFCLASLGTLFKLSIDIFWSKTLKLIHFWGPRLSSEAHITPFCTQITQNFSKKILPYFAQYTSLFKFSIDIFWSKTLKNVQASHLHLNLGLLFKYIFTFYKWYKLL